MTIDFAKLREPFALCDVEFRLAQCGKNSNGIWAKCLAYITNRAIMSRLDEVCGPENWANQFETAPGGGILCGIAVRVGDQWVTKWDGADQTEIEAVKGGLSGAMKRAAVQWGIGRYLYDLDEAFADITDNRDDYFGKTKDGDVFRWCPPPLPSWALPGGAGHRPEAKPAPAAKPTPQEGSDEMGDAFDEADVRSFCDRIRMAATLADVDAIEAEAARLQSAEARQRVHVAAGNARTVFKRAEAAAAPKKPKGSAKLRDDLLKSLDAARAMQDVKNCYEALLKYEWSAVDRERLMDRVSMRKADFANAAGAK